MLKASKSMTYATRRLKAGDLFTPRNRSDARVLVALGRAERVVDGEAVGHMARPHSKAHSHRPAPTPAPTPAPAPTPTPTPAPAPAPTPAPTPAPATAPAGGHDDVADLRKQYEAKFHKKPFNGWDAATLREKLAA
jgi:hypothetical protein